MPKLRRTLRSHEKITVLTNTQVEEVSGDTALRYLRYRNYAINMTAEYRPPESDTFGLFVFAGYTPAIEPVHILDERGYSSDRC